MKKHRVVKTLLRKVVNFLALSAILIAALSLESNPTFAQKKKGKNNDGADEAAKMKAYKFELDKTFSFGWENYKNKQYRNAVKHFLKLAEIDTIGKHPRVFRYLGDSFMKLENPDSAQVMFELGIEKYPDDVYLHRMRGFLLANRQQIEEAIVEYEKVVELKPDSDADWMQLADLYVRDEQDEDAIAAYDKVLELDPENMDAQKRKTALIAATGDIEAVIAEEEKIRNRDPQNSRVRFDLGKRYFTQEDYEKSIQRFNEFLALSPDDVQAMGYIASAYQNLERYHDAISEYKKIIETGGEDDKRVLSDIGRCYKELGRFSSSRTYASKALAIDRSYGLAWIALGEAYEASADRCVKKNGGQIGFDDNLVYELAYQKYRMAGRDEAFRGDANRHISYLQAVLPTTEKMFMHKGQKTPEGGCYAWVSQSEFGTRYWNSLDRRLGRK